MNRFQFRSSLKVTVILSALLIALFTNSPIWAKAGKTAFNFPGLVATVTVYEDVLGIPTIVAESEHDAVFVLGYLHARDRFWQMDRDRDMPLGAEDGAASAVAVHTFRPINSLASPVRSRVERKRPDFLD
jgi:acyl-homoserine lactone acylase PvdQ